MVYKWNAYNFPVDAQTAGEELERIASDGELTPQRIVDESRPEDAPLHKCFEWDDQKAAEGFRRQQARIITCNLITDCTGEEDAEPVRAFVHITNEYKPVNVVLKSREMTNTMLANAKAEMEAFIQKYGRLQELASVVQAMEEVIDK